jgi:hypothetical protein
MRSSALALAGSGLTPRRAPSVGILPRSLYLVFAMVAFFRALTTQILDLNVVLYPARGEMYLAGTTIGTMRHKS